mmetsp:Transcript_15304/g.44239  ORF Transcript_15304/g.44239 Transcript_15304/m.44239 type:complete len:1601 (+) Transcript_15304:988-5790(+)
MVRNKAGDTKCAACETVRPGCEDQQEKSGDGAAASGATIGAGGFSFAGAAAAAPASSIGSGGFSFGGATATAPAPASAALAATSSGGGFSFGAKPASTTTGPTSGGFSFGTSSANKESDTTSEKKVSGGFSLAPSMSGSDIGAAPATGGFQFGSKVSSGKSEKEDEKKISSASFPPLATKAPTPFSASASSKAPAPAPPVAKATPSSSAFPPMSVAPPKNPFSAARAAPAPAAKPAAASAAFPPLSAKAPKPFGGGAGAAEPKTSDTKPATKPAASAAFPPMPSKAPTPFSASVKAPAPAAAAKKPAPAGFPPMSATAPKSPFSAAAPAPAPAAKSSVSTAFPPMSKAAPINPFGSPKPAPAPAAAASAAPRSGFAFGGGNSAAAKPVPAPAFGSGGGGLTFGSAPAPAPAAATKAAPKTSSFGAAPAPAAAAAPAAATSTPVAAAAQTPKTKDRAPPSSTALVVPKYEAATEYEAELWRGVMEFDKSLSSIKNLAKSLSDTKIGKDNADLEKKIERMIDTCDQARSMAMSIDDKVAAQTDRAVFLLSRKDDLQRQESEAERLINEQLRDQEGGSLLRDQPLDAETEKTRRHLASSALETQHAIANVKDRICLLRDILQAREVKPARSAFSFGSPRSAPDHKLKAQRTLKENVLRGYERAQQLSKTAEDLQKRVKEAADAVPGASGASVPTSARKSRSRIAPLPVNFASPSAVAKRQAQKKAAATATETENITQKQSTVENAIRTLGRSQYSIPVRKFSRRGIIGSDPSQTRDATATNWRFKGATSQLMGSTTATPLPKMGALMSLAATPSASTPSRSLFTPPPAGSTGKERSADWNAKTDVDQTKFNNLQASLQMPSTVKTITSEDAARKALQSFGTDPERTAKAREVKAREGRQAAVASASAAPASAAGESKIPSTIKKKSSAAAAGAFPPISSTAPVPFSLKSDDGGGKKKVDAFPPMSLKGPSPSPLGAKKKNDDSPSGLTPKAAMSSSAKKDAGGLRSGNLFGLSRPDSAKKDDAAKPFGSGGGGLSGFGSDLGSALGGPANAASTPPKPAPAAPDYSALLTEFFQTHNPTKVGNVDKVLTKYKGQEEKLFRTLAHKYGVANPLADDAGSKPAPSSSAGGISSPPLSLSSISTPASSKPTMSASPFGAPALAPPPLVTANEPAPAPTPGAAAPSGSGASDYRTILHNFYQQHKPTHLAEVDKLLVKYNGREPEMFAKLAKKYNVPNPLPADMQGGTKPPTAPPGTSGGSSLFGGSVASSAPAFGSTPANAPAPSPFGGAPAAAPSPSPFGGGGGAPAPSPSPFGGGQTTQAFGSTAASSNAFGSSAPSPSPFGTAASNAPAPSPFGAPSSSAPAPAFGGGTSGGFGTSAAASTPFGKPPAPAAQQSPFGPPVGAAPSPFGAPATSAAPAAGGGTKLFNGKTAREMLTAFYQQKDPSKLASIDKFLTKYAGQEDQLFRNLAKKYNIDPSMFGVSAAAPTPAAGGFGGAVTSPGGFGQQSALGGGSLFGSPPVAAAPSAGGFGQTAPIGSGAPGFGSSTGAGGSGFGSLAQSGGGGGFGAAAAPAAGGFGGMGGGGGFGSPAPAPGAFGSPFGSARR